MATPTIPTRMHGRADDVAYAEMLGDALEHIGDLTYPLSIQQYAIMRRDPTLSAILQGYFLQILRANWALDPAGCRPEVAAVCADDTGLRVLGVDRPGPARVRGVTWPEHLRAALLSLVYGHYGFELQADVSSDRARLIGLWDRPPWTISDIDVDPQSGALLGVSQDVVGRDQPSQITADRLCWYTHGKEASNWVGTSLLRPAWAAHLLKREALRILGVSTRRFGMGVPVMEALPGTNPSPAQMSEALQLAAEAKAGDRAGAATPPGFTLKLLGMTGGAPPTLDFVRYLDQQMSRMALMNHLELAQGSSGGSRALGETFVDSWTLALGAIADAVATQATRQIVARIVEWNNGPDEPVPAVVVSGIGDRRETTAESLQLLLSSGALSADPGLESWIRREWRLPEREAMTPPKVTAPGVDLGKGGREPADDVEDNPPAEVKAAADPESEPQGEPTTDTDQLQAEWEAALAAMLLAWPAAAGPMVDDLTGQIVQAVEAGNTGRLGSVTVTAGVVAAVAAALAAAGVGLAATAAAGVVLEAARQGVEIALPRRAGEKRIRDVARAVAGVLASGYATGASRAALLVAGKDTDAATVAEAVRAHLVELGRSERGFVADNLRGLLTAAQNAGRTAVMEAAETTGRKIRYRVLETLDQNTCQPCRDADGREFDSLEAAKALYPVQGNLSCLGRSRCRGLVAPIWG